MALTELTENEIEGRTAVGRPILITVPAHGFPDYFERVRRMINTQAPEGAKSFTVEEKSTPVLVEVKTRTTPLINSGQKISFRIEEQVWYAHPVQYFG